MDTRSARRHPWLYGLPATALTIAFAVWAAMLPDDASVLARVGLAVGGVIGGAVIIGTLTFAVTLLLAPIRQRNEARRALGHGLPDVQPLSEEFDAFVTAARAAYPRGGWVSMDTLFMRDSEERARARNRYNEQFSEAKRTALLKYHAEFRDRVLAVLAQPQNEAWRDRFEAVARDPGNLGDLDALNDTLKRVADDAAPERDTRTNAMRDVLDELSSIAVRLERAEREGHYAWNLHLPSAEYHEHKGALPGDVRARAARVYVRLDDLQSQLAARGEDNAAVAEDDDLRSLIRDVGEARATLQRRLGLPTDD